MIARAQRMAIAVATALAAMAPGIGCAAAAEVSYYEVPHGAHPHDVAPAPDGNVWYTAQSQGALGILAPKTGRVTQVSLGPDSAPHGVIVGPDRAAWVTDGGQNAVLRVDPATRTVKLFPLPKEFPDANLNTATFDRKGILWFTGQNGVYGRVDPASGKVEAWKAPKGVGPYGITTTPKGDVWYASLAGDHIAKIDTVSGDACGAATKGRRRPAPHLVGLQGAAMGEFLEYRRGRPLRSAGQDLESVELPTTGRLLRGLCRRQGHGLGQRLAGQRDLALRSGEREIRKLPEQPAPRRRAAILGRPGELWGGIRAPTGWCWCGNDRRDRPPECAAVARRRRGFGGRRRAEPCRRGAHRQAHRRSAGARVDVATHRLHLAGADRHAISRLHAGRRTARAGTIRRARRRLRLRHLLRDRAGRRHRARTGWRSATRCARSAIATGS